MNILNETRMVFKQSVAPNSFFSCFHVIYVITPFLHAAGTMQKTPVIVYDKQKVTVHFLINHIKIEIRSIFSGS